MRFLLTNRQRSEALLAREEVPFGPLRLGLLASPSEELERALGDEAAEVALAHRQSLTPGVELFVAPSPKFWRSWCESLLAPNALGSVSWLTHRALRGVLAGVVPHTCYSSGFVDEPSRQAAARILAQRALVDRCALLFVGKADASVELMPSEVVVTAHAEKAFVALERQAKGLLPWLPTGWRLSVRPSSILSTH